MQILTFTFYINKMYSKHAWFKDIYVNLFWISSAFSDSSKGCQWMIKLGSVMLPSNVRICSVHRHHIAQKDRQFTHSGHLRKAPVHILSSPYCSVDTVYSCQCINTGVNPLGFPKPFRFNSLLKHLNKTAQHWSLTPEDSNPACILWWITVVP